MKNNNWLRIILTILIFLSSGAEVYAKEMYAFIKSKDLTQINNIIAGFNESFPDASTSVLDLQGEGDVNKITRFINKEKPSVIISMGSLAASTAVKAEKKIPIIFSMVINYNNYPELKQNNVTGVSMEIPPESLFTQFRMLIPEVKSVGVPFHPSVSSGMVNEALNVCGKVGVQLIKIEVDDPDYIRYRLAAYAKQYQGLWMLADTKLYNRNTGALSELLSFAKSEKKPVLAFSEAFLRAGAFFSISIDYRALGSQLAMVSRRVVQDKVEPLSIPVSPPIGTYTVINKNVATALLGSDLDESIYDEVDKVYSEKE